jgi:hypothetical protein
MLAAGRAERRDIAQGRITRRAGEKPFDCILLRPFWWELGLEGGADLIL